MVIFRNSRVVMVLICAVTLLSVWGSASAVAEKPSGVIWSELERKYEGVFVLSASRDSRKVALTFDDVPDPRFTPAVLDVLRAKKVRATFFVVGTRIVKNPAIVRRIHREGHVVGNHSYSHPDFSKLRLSKMQEQILRTEKVINRVVGFKPKLVRPPYGEIVPVQLEWAMKRGYTVVNWDVDSSDWKQIHAIEIFRNVTRAVRPGSVVLMHAGGGEGQDLSGTIKALPSIINWLRAHEYEMVTLTELLRIPEKRIETISVHKP